MSKVSLVGNEIINLNDNLISDLAEGTVATLTFDDDIASLATGKNGNTIYTLNESGKAATLTLRVLRGTENDIYLNSLMVLLETDLPSFPLIYGEIIKRIGDGQGVVKKDTYVLSGGIFTRKVDYQEDNR